MGRGRGRLRHLRGQPPGQETTPARLPGVDASLLRQAGRGFYTGVVAAVAFCLIALVLTVTRTVIANGEGVIGSVRAIPFAVFAALPVPVVVGALVGPVPGVLGGLSAGVAARRVRTLRTLRLAGAVGGAALATASVVLLGLLSGGLVPFLLGLAVGGPALPGIPFPYGLSGGYVFGALYGALVGALHACWAASGPTSLTRPCGSLTCVPSLLLTRPR